MTFIPFLMMKNGSRSSHRGCSVKKGVLKNFANFTGTYLCWSPSGLQLYLKETPKQALSCAKFARTPIFKNTSGGCFCDSRAQLDSFKVWYSRENFLIKTLKRKNDRYKIIQTHISQPISSNVSFPSTGNIGKKCVRILKFGFTSATDK